MTSNNSSSSSSSTNGTGSPSRPTSGPPSSPASSSTPASSRFSFNAMAAALPKTGPASPKQTPSRASTAPQTSSSGSTSPLGAKTLGKHRTAGPPPRPLPTELFVLITSLVFQASKEGAPNLFHNDRQLSKCFVAPEDAAALGLCVGDIVSLASSGTERDGQDETASTGSQTPIFATLWPSSSVAVTSM